MKPTTEPPERRRSSFAGAAVAGPAIRVEGLRKKYCKTFRRGVYYMGLDLLAGAVGRPPSARLRKGEFWALDGIDLEVNRGECLGVIGANGAGKSTLLKVLSGIIEPTQGAATLRGRVGSLIEIGAGFHPDLSARDNIYVNGALLGLKRRNITERFDEIVEFAGVGEFLETPVRFFSSGMYVRLGFAIAAHLEPDILLIDEVLAVGDARFQRKCLGKLGEAWGGSHTVLFVSHNMTAVASLCKRVCWVDKGKVRMVGPSGEVVAAYLSDGGAAVSARTWEFATAPGDDIIRLHSVSIAPVSGAEGDLITTRSELELYVSYWNQRAGEASNISVMFYTREGVCAFSTASDSRVFPKGLVEGRCRIPADFLNEQGYRVRVMIVVDASRVLLDVTNAVEFEVHEIHRDNPWFGKIPGVVRPRLNWSAESVPGECPSLPGSRLAHEMQCRPPHDPIG